MKEKSLEMKVVSNPQLKQGKDNKNSFKKIDTPQNAGVSHRQMFLATLTCVRVTP